MFIEIRDNRDKDLSCQAILTSIRELADLRDKAGEWGCGTMTIEDSITRLQYILKEASNA